MFIWNSKLICSNTNPTSSHSQLSWVLAANGPYLTFSVGPGLKGIWVCVCVQEEDGAHLEIKAPLLLPPKRVASCSDWLTRGTRSRCPFLKEGPHLCVLCAGWQPLEARRSQVPAMATSCTFLSPASPSHSDRFLNDVIRIPDSSPVLGWKPI